MSKWYEEAVFYHMYPIGMTGAPRENKQEGMVGRFEQLNQWLPHVSQIGCDAIYIGPLFESTSHGYDTRDYKQVDKRLGSNEDFRNFVLQAHELGIKVVVDGVFNHTGREHFAFLDIQKNRENSSYCSWYKGVNFGGNNPYKDGFSYEAWRNCYELVNLNFGEAAVGEYLLGVIDFWIDEFDIDGIRLDCADCLEFSFLEKMRSRTEQRKADFWLMGEVIHGDYARYIGDGSKMLHSVTNYELHKGLYSSHNDHNYFEAAHTIRREFDQNGGIYKGLKLYSLVDNHDVDRIASKLTVSKNLNPVYTLLYTLPGIPSIYYGSEWGLEGRKEGANDNPLRPAIDLEKTLAAEKDSMIMSWVKALGKLHREHPCLAYGEYRELMLTNGQYAFSRTMEGDSLVVVVNNEDKDAQASINGLPGDKKYMDTQTGEEETTVNGQLSLNVKANSSRILAMI